MKKMLKLLGIMAALAMVLGFGLTACSSGDDDDDEPTFKASTAEKLFSEVITDFGLDAGTTFAAEQVTIEDTTIATIEVGADKFIVTSKKAGKTYVLYGGEKVYEVNVAADGKVTIVIADEQGGEESGLPWSFDFETLKSATWTGTKFTLGTWGTVKDDSVYAGEWSKDSDGKAGLAEYIDTALLVCSPGTSGTMGADDAAKPTYLSWGGGYEVAFNTTTVGETLDLNGQSNRSAKERYIGIDPSKFEGVNGKVIATITWKSAGSGNSTGATGQLVVVDGEGKILYYSDVNNKDGSEPADIVLTMKPTDKAFLYYSRNGDKGGSINITGIKLELAPPVAVSKVTLDKPTANLLPNEEVQLTATVEPDDAADKTVTWTSSDENIAVVDATGKVTAKAAGKVTITAKAGEQTATCAVEVISAENSVKVTVKIGGTEVENSPFTLVKGKDYTEDELYTMAKIVKGEIKSVVPAAVDGKYNFTEDTTIEVTYRAISGITITTQPTKTEYKVGEKFNPAGLVISVDYDFGPSETDISYNATDFSFEPALDAALAAENTNVVLTYKGNNANIPIVVKAPAYADVPFVGAISGITEDEKWYGGVKDASAFDESNIIQYDPVFDSLVVKSGTAQTTAYYRLPDAKTTGKWVVSAKVNIKKAIGSWTFLQLCDDSGNEFAGLRVEKSPEVKTRADGAALSETGTNITINKEMEVSVLVNFTKKVIKAKIGETELPAIEFTTGSTGLKYIKVFGNFKSSDATEIEVKDLSIVQDESPDEVVLVSSVAISGSKTFNLEVGAEKTLLAKASPADADEKGLTWASSDSNIVSVDENGKITAVAKGEATITVSAKDSSGKSDSVTVTVTPAYKKVTWAFASGTDGVSEITTLTPATVTTFSTNTEITWKIQGETDSLTSAYVYTTDLKKTVAEVISNTKYATLTVKNEGSAAVTLKSISYYAAIKDKSDGYGCAVKYKIGSATDTTDLADAKLSKTNGELVNGTGNFAANTTLAAGETITLMFCYYGGSNGSKVCALRDVVLSVEE